MAKDIIADATEDEDFQKLLDDFITSELKDVETGLENKPAPAPAKKPAPNKKAEPAPASTPAPAPAPAPDDNIKRLKKNEKNLFIAYSGFIESVNYIADKFKLKPVKAGIKAAMLLPNYKPSIGKIIRQDALNGWDVMIKAYPEQIKAVNPAASDDELLDFAEAASDNQLTLAIISYVETVIELDGSELYYQDRLIKSRKKRIEREIYEEYQNRVARCKRYIKAIEKKKFPINAEKLVNNYFKTAQNDADGAYKVLITNPATFAPIDFSKIKAKFFGLIKVKPTDGYKINKNIGKFLKRLKA